MNENVSGELEYLVNITKFNNVSNIVLGFDENFGSSNTILKFIGLPNHHSMIEGKIFKLIHQHVLLVLLHKSIFRYYFG